jgi:integrase
MTRLTDAAIRAIKPDGRRVDLPDGAVPGLALRVGADGTRAWAVRVRWQGRQVRVRLGEWPATTLAEARRLAQEARKLADRGQDPEAAVRPPAPVEQAPTVQAAIGRWMATKRANRSAPLEARRMALHVVPAVGGKRVDQVVRADISSLLHDLVHVRGLTAEANRVHTSLRGFWRWVVEMGWRETDPLTGVRKPVREEASQARMRTETVPLLSLDELAALYRAAPSIRSAVLGDLTRALLLIPLRREEVTALAWAEVRPTVDDGWSGTALVIGADRLKGKRPAVVPLSSQAAALIEGRRALTGSVRFVFAVPGHDTPFRGWKRGAEVLRALTGRDDWSPHTIRKSIATACVRDLGADETLVARLLQHSPRATLGVTHVYQRSRRLKEQADLLRRWADLLEATAAGARGADVVPLRVPA